MTPGDAVCVTVNVFDSLICRIDLKLDVFTLCLYVL